MMKRLTLMLFVALAAMALTTSALAQPASMDKRPTTTTTEPATTDHVVEDPPAVPLVACEEAAEATVTEPGRTVLRIDGSGNASFECLWTPENTGVDVATVTITSVEGAVRGIPTVFVRDDSPGDICLLEQSWLDDAGEPQVGPPYTASFDLAYGAGLPPGYEIWEGTTYWTFQYDTDHAAGQHWCAPQDTVLDSLRYDYNGGPLHFQVNFSARRGGTVVIELTP